MDSVLFLLFIGANIGIFLGYCFLGARVVPKAAARLKRTKIGGVLFFTTCGLTHLELASHLAVQGQISLREFLSWHMITIHLVQVVSVWLFVTGLYLEYVKWGPWRAAHEGNGNVHAGRLIGLDDARQLPDLGR